MGSNHQLDDRLIAEAAALGKDRTKKEAVIPTSFSFSTMDRVVGLGLCLGAIFTAFRLDRPCRIRENVRGRPGGQTLPCGRRTKSKCDGPLVSLRL